MGKSSSYPSFSSGTIKVNGKNIASASKDGNNIVSSYNMSKKEKELYKNVQKGLSTSVANLFNFSDNQLNLWNKELDAYKQDGIKSINEIYTPMETNLRNDIATRFGNLDNSIFLDNLNAITDKKASAISDLSNSLLEKQDELYQTEMKNRINYISLLSNLNSALNGNILNYTTSALNNAQSGNNHNANAYKATNSNPYDFNQLASTMLSFI